MIWLIVKYVGVRFFISIFVRLALCAFGRFALLLIRWRYSTKHEADHSHAI